MRARLAILAFSASLALAGPCIAQEAPNPAEIAFWTSVKDSKNPAELRAYLTAFPSGLFSQLARLRLEELEKPVTAAPAPTLAPPAPRPQQPAAAPPQPASPPTASAVDLSSTGAIREIQLKLYDLNYDPGRVDGVMHADTRKSIREWQQAASLPVTGEMTADGLTRLRAARPSSSWAAVAYTARGANGWVFGKPSRAEAEQTAIDLCLKRGGSGAKCTPITASGSACITMASYTTKKGTTTYFGSHVALRANQTSSISEALRLCSEAENSGNNCAAKVTICADGSHKK